MLSNTGYVSFRCFLALILAELALQFSIVLRLFCCCGFEKASGKFAKIGLNVLNLLALCHCVFVDFCLQVPRGGRAGQHTGAIQYGHRFLQRRRCRLILIRLLYSTLSNSSGSAFSACFRDTLFAILCSNMICSRPCRT